MSRATRLRRSVIVAAVGSAVLLSGVMTAPAEAVIRKPERQLARLVNRLRADNDRDRLRHTRKLHRVAERNSKKMAQTGQVQHTQDIPCNGWNGETVGIGDSVRQAFRRMKNSPAHRAIMLAPQAERMGTGVRKDDDGIFYVTVVFCA